MSIKEILRRNNISLSEFATVLGISRPTLNAYIDMYDNGKKIPKEKYQRIFSILFSNERLNDFQTNYSEICNFANYDNNDLNNKKGVLKEKILTTTLENINQDFKSDDCDVDVYKFINILLSSYKREPLFSHVVRYFLILNGKIDYHSVDFEEEKYLLYYFELFSKDMHNNLDYSYMLHKEFINRINQLKKNKNKKNDTIEQRLLKEIKREIQIIQDLGIELSDDELIDFLRERINSK